MSSSTLLASTHCSYALSATFLDLTLSFPFYPFRNVPTLCGQLLGIRLEEQCTLKTVKMHLAKQREHYQHTYITQDGPRRPSGVAPLQNLPPQPPPARLLLSSVTPPTSCAGHATSTPKMKPSSPPSTRYPAVRPPIPLLPVAYFIPVSSPSLYDSSDSPPPFPSTASSTVGTPKPSGSDPTIQS